MWSKGRGKSEETRDDRESEMFQMLEGQPS